MSALAQLLRAHQEAFVKHYKNVMERRHYQAMQAIIDCHTPACGELLCECPACKNGTVLCHSCGHRSCPACQGPTQQQWLARQQEKRLPVDYYMVTFTLPYELRRFVWKHQTWAYQTLFQCAVDTLRTFAKNDKQIGEVIGMTGVLHTHTRRLDYHPHVHFIVPGGGFDAKRQRWQATSKKYLFNGIALAKVFRGKFIAALKEKGFYLPQNIPKNWITQTQAAGRGDEAVKYLSTYLYRGVIRDQNILGESGGQVTFEFRDSQTKTMQRQSEPVLTFLWKVLQHVLPKGFRRSRDYGLLHGNAKKLRQRLQLMLKLKPLAPTIERPKPKLCCSNCGGMLKILQCVWRRQEPMQTTR